MGGSEPTFDGVGGGRSDDQSVVMVVKRRTESERAEVRKLRSQWDSA